MYGFDVEPRIWGEDDSGHPLGLACGFFGTFGGLISYLDKNCRIYDWYSFEIIPVVGQVVAGDWRSYKYLVESIRQFPDQTEFAAMIERAGFSNVKYDNLSNGIVAIHYGMKK